MKPDPLFALMVNCAGFTWNYGSCGRVLFLFVLTATVLWEICSGTSYLRYGGRVYRRDDPKNFWGGVGFEIFCLVLLLVGWVWRLRN